MKPKEHPLNRMITLVGLILGVGGSIHAQAPLCESALPRVRPAGAPACDDICFSSRWPHPLNATDPHDTFAAMEAFHATRMDWNYPRADVSFVREVRQRGYAYFGAINCELPDVPGGSERTRGRDRTFEGKPVGNPELARLTARGDVASEDYYDVVFSYVKILIDGGADGIQVDDPGMTYTNALWEGGGYGDASLAAFREFLAGHTTADQREQWGLPPDITDFDYAVWLRARETDPPEALRETFLAFHRESLDHFYTRLRAETNDYAGRQVPFSANNTSAQNQADFPYVRHFDYWIGETSIQYGEPTAKRVYAKTKYAESIGKMQVFSPPNDGLDRIPTRDAYVVLTRKLIATSYACGTTTLVPWDVWRRGPGTPRFYGTAEEFGDLFDLIAAHKDLFARHEEAFAAGAGVEPTAPDGLGEVPIRIVDAPDVLAAVRAVPGDGKAPIAVHLVDWSESPAGFTLALRNVAFTGEPDPPLRAMLHTSGASPEVLPVKPGEDGWSVLSIPALHPYGVLSIGNASPLPHRQN